jgi:trehalose-phosphatase
MRAPENVDTRTTRQTIGDFLAALSAAPARALLLDYDGTLAPLVPERDRAFPYPGVRETLAQLLAGGRTRIVIVSGRPARKVERLLGLDPHPEIWGSHGLERMGVGGRLVAAAPLPRPASELLAAIRDWIFSHGWIRLYEEKPFGFALHSRGADPEMYATAMRNLLEQWRLSAETSGLEVMAFDGGIELRPAGSHKGMVVQTLLAEMPAGSTVAYLGDDLTDEDAFAALGRRGLSVLLHEEWRPTAADVWLKPEELLPFLSAWERAVS